MDKKAIETLAVNAVRDSIVVSDFLDQFIPDNDKEPSWDGFIYVYKHKSKTKEQLKGRLPVQVKGTENSNFSKEEISYPVSVSDLNNYLNDGGVKTALITVKDKLYYDKVIFLQDADTATTIIGESFSMTANKNDHSMKVKYKSSNKIRVLATDLEFILAYIANGGFQYNGVEFPFIMSEADLSNFSIEEESKRLEYTKKIVQMLDTLGCKKDIDIKTLTDKDWQNIYYLVTAFVDKKPVSGLKADLPVILIIPVGELKFIVALQKVDGHIGTYEISDFFNTDFAVVDERPDGEKIPISQFALLKADDLLKADNIRFEALLPSFQKTEYHRETFARATLFLLDLISAYDKSGGRCEIINTATSFSDWIMTAPEEDMDHNISLLNKLQIVKRLRSLNDDEEKELVNIIENPDVREDVLVGAYLLLDQQAAAKIHFNKLDKEQQDLLKGYPIFYFWKS